MDTLLTAIASNKNRLAHKGAWLLMNYRTRESVKQALSSLSGQRQRSGRQHSVPVQHLLSRHVDTLTILGEGFLAEHSKTVEAFPDGYWRLVNTVGETIEAGSFNVEQSE
jgi:hypothetical protein